MRLQFQGLDIGQGMTDSQEVVVSDLDWGSLEIRSEDWDLEGRDGSLPGRDYFGRRSATFDLATDRYTMAEARETVAEFLEVWRHESLRSQSGLLVPLDFQAVEDPRWRRVYGRPRQATDPHFDVLMAQGVGRVSCTFDVFEPRVFAGGDEGLHQVRVDQHDGASVGGWRFPGRFPFSSERAGGAREGFIQVGGRVPTSPTITIHGPGRGLRLRGNRGWHVGIGSDVQMASHENLTLDPLAGTVELWHDSSPGTRRSAFGMLDNRTRVTGLTLPPGAENVFFSGIDETRESYALIEWRDAFMSLA